MEKKKFRLADVILSVICVVFVAEAAAPVASIGNSQYFWWIFMILAFLLPYGLIAAELGTAYAGDGGLYDWVHAAYPNGRWAARASWYYWINFPLWMASLAVMCPELITFITGRSLGTPGSLAVELLFIWIVTLIACYPKFCLPCLSAGSACGLLADTDLSTICRHGRSCRRST